MNVKAARIINFGDSEEAALLRAILEQLGLRVTVENSGNPVHFLEALNEFFQVDFLIIAGHGKQNGLFFGEFIASVDTSLLRDGYLPVDEIRAQSKGATVISSACSTGNAEFAAVFQKAGANAFLGPASDPDGVAVPMILHQFFYNQIVEKQPRKKSLINAQANMNKENQFELFEFGKKDIS
ncbi:MAG: caspase family protein [Devosiaceae bacterium]|nr:caspase family protein [Devosiaceae bacterium]